MLLLARLPMYDLPELAGANDAFWAALSGRLRRDGVADLPEALDRSTGNQESWASPRLVFGQSCGYPLMTSFRDRLRVLATPAYGAVGCAGVLHRAWIVVARGAPFRSLEALRGCSFAINSRESNTGCNLPRRLFAPLARKGQFFGAVIEAGSHLASASAVADRIADAASIDCVSWAFLERHRPTFTEQLRILGATPASPGLPWVTAAATPDAVVAALQRALAEVMASPELAAMRDELMLKGADVDADYSTVLRYEAEAGELGYPVLA